MRTTLDIDPEVLSAARAKAHAENISLGRAISELALAGLRALHPELREASGFPVMRGIPGHPVTDKMVTDHRDDATHSNVA